MRKIILTIMLFSVVVVSFAITKSDPNNQARAESHSAPQVQPSKDKYPTQKITLHETDNMDHDITFVIEFYNPYKHTPITIIEYEGFDPKSWKEQWRHKLSLIDSKNIHILTATLIPNDAGYIWTDYGKLFIAGYYTGILNGKLATNRGNGFVMALGAEGAKLKWVKTISGAKGSNSNGVVLIDHLKLHQRNGKPSLVATVSSDVGLKLGSQTVHDQVNTQAFTVGFSVDGKSSHIIKNHVTRSAGEGL